VVCEGKETAGASIVEDPEGHDVVSLNLAKTAQHFKGTAVWSSAFISLESSSGKVVCRHALTEAGDCTLLLNHDVFPGKSVFTLSVYSEGSSGRDMHFSQRIQFDIDNPNAKPLFSILSEWYGANIAAPVSAQIRELGKIGPKIQDTLGRTAKGLGDGAGSIAAASTKLAEPLGRLGARIRPSLDRARSQIAEPVARLGRRLYSLDKKKLLLQGGAVGAGIVASYGAANLAQLAIRTATARRASAAAAATAAAAAADALAARGKGGAGMGLILALSGVAAAILAGAQRAASAVAVAALEAPVPRTVRKRVSCWFLALVEKLTQHANHHL